MVLTVVPSYIRPITSPSQSPQGFYTRTSTNYNHPIVSRGTPTPSLARLSPFYEQGQNARAEVNPSIDFTADSEDCGTFPAFLEQPLDVLMTGFDFPDIPSPQTFSSDCGPNSIRPGQSCHNSSIQHELGQPDGARTIQPTRERSTPRTNTDWWTFFTLSPATTFADGPSDLDPGPLQDTQERYC